jgi:putative oxidoreductase
MNTGLIVLRLALAAIMFFHGTTKLFGWWGGEGLDGAARFFASQGFRPPRLLATIAGGTETAAAILLGTGLLTPIGVAMLTGVLTNVLALHFRNGLDHRRHGFELELAILAGVVAIGLAGPGRWSLDAWLGTPGWSWLGPVAVLLGIVGGMAVVATRDRSGAPVSGATVPERAI